MRSFALSRRTLLRGTLGGAMALPLIEPMLDGRRGAQAADPPKRYFIAFAGQSTGADGDKVHNLYAPDTVGPGYDPATKAVLAPLVAGGLGREVTIVSGLRVPPGAGPGHWEGGFHGGNHSPLLSGVPCPGAQAGTAAIKGPTSDQIVADAIAGSTRFRSLEYCVQPKVYSGGPYYGWIMSMRRNGATLERREPVVSPQLAYKSLFYNFQKPDDPAAQKAFDLDRRIRVSILDSCGSSRARLARQVGSADLAILDQYYEHCRDLEKRLASLTSTQGTGLSCSLPPDPGADPAIGVDTGSSMNGTGAVPSGTGWSNETLRGKLFCDLVAMAFACDLTRVASLVITRNQCFMSARDVAGYGVDVHTLTHASGGSPCTTAAVSKGLAWSMSHFARVVSNLRTMKDATGKTLLDNSALVMVNEGGHGAAPDSKIVGGTAHSMENMVCAIAGGAGSLKRGHHVVAGGKHPANVLVTLMNAVGVPTTQLGEVTGSLPDLVAT
jgi:hypothetical protein